MVAATQSNGRGNWAIQLLTRSSLVFFFCVLFFMLVASWWPCGIGVVFAVFHTVKGCASKRRRKKRLPDPASGGLTLCNVDRRQLCLGGVLLAYLSSGEGGRGGVKVETLCPLTRVALAGMGGAGAASTQGLTKSASSGLRDGIGGQSIHDYGLISIFLFGRRQEVAQSRGTAAMVAMGCAMGRVLGRSCQAGVNRAVHFLRRPPERG